MSDFPQLKSGAVAQYPAQKSIAYSTQVMRFLDGTEQRFRHFGAPVRRWVIQLDLLDEAELAAMEQFFLGEQGRLGEFEFTDPWTGAVHTNCSLDEDDARLDYLREGRGNTTLIVRENRS
ncbi:MAG: DUF2460 domain-containing protein [bacterium]|nr:DUF2460 domain-containing protein [bacterium]